MPRKLQIEMHTLSGAIAECVVWVNHQLVIDQTPTGQPPAASWTGKVPTGTTPVTIEASGVGTSRYGVKIVVDGAVVTDVDRQLQGGVDVFEKSV